MRLSGVRTKTFGELMRAQPLRGDFPRALPTRAANSPELAAKNLKKRFGNDRGGALTRIRRSAPTRERTRIFGPKRRFEAFQSIAYWYSPRYLKKIPQINLITYTCAQVWPDGPP
ncbi:hypothetical protein [Paraburkholderia sp. J41]|uniref:hypothetical protein n=1 Tax=Paraburkholderia sp. J41 TaxID=2805433 RepID=UPI002AC31FA2|nr:hypothetical protein [Paraburkholderia sp. J41]